MQTINSCIKILLLEYVREEAEFIEFLLQEINKYKLTRCSRNELLKQIEPNEQLSWDVVLLFFKASYTDQIDLIQSILEKLPTIPLIFVTNNQQDQVTIKKQILNFYLQPSGIQEYITTSQISALGLEYIIDSAIAKTKLAEQINNLKQDNLSLQTQLTNTKELFKTVVDTTSTLILLIDAQENYTFLNQSWLSFIGKTLEEGLQETWRDRIHPEDLAKFEQVYQSALKKCQGFQIEYRLRRFDDNYRTILNTAVRRYSATGEFAGFLCSCLDITQRKKIEKQLVRQSEIDHILAEITQNIYTSLELNVILQTATEQVSQYLGIGRIFVAKIINCFSLSLLATSGQQNCDLDCHECWDDKKINQAIFANLNRLSQGEIISQDNTTISDLICENNLQLSPLCFSRLLIPILSRNHLWGVMIVEHEYDRCWHLDEIKLLKRIAIQLGIAIKQSELYRELQELSVVDGLTKIANRRKFDRHLATEWKRLTREQNPLSLILCDVDHFKLYNDTYGHQAGDRCLYQVAQAISKVVKRPADLVARYGGEEFVIILPNTSLSGAKYLAQKIRLQIASLHLPHINSLVDIYVTLSFGIASCIPRQDLEYSSLVSAADRGLYQAKELGRNRIVPIESF